MLSMSSSILLGRQLGSTMNCKGEVTSNHNGATTVPGQLIREVADLALAESQSFLFISFISTAALGPEWVQWDNHNGAPVQCSQNI